MTGADAEVVSNNEILIGGAPCKVLSTNNGRVQAQVGASPSGTHDLMVRVAGKGKARMSEPITFTVNPSVTTIAPATGSMGGRCLRVVSG